MQVEHMTSRCRRAFLGLQFLVEAALHLIGRMLSVLWAAAHGQPDCILIEVLLAERARRRAVKRHVRAALRRLRRVLGAQFPSDAAVIVQQVVVTERQLAGCYQISHEHDGTRIALIRLALEVDGRPLTTDELLAVLAEQCIALAMQSAGPGLLAPIALAPSRSDDPGRPPALRPDPLATVRDRTERSA
jgi:hypothetical protein